MSETTDPSFDFLLDGAKRIARLAGETIMYYYNSDRLSDEFIQTKMDNSPVTEADLASNAIILNELKQLTPDYPVISEEDVNAKYEERANYGRVWIIDPLDGTKEFMAQNGEFAIHIGLVERGQPILGVVFAPALNTLYFASKKNGAYCETEKEPVRQIRAREVDLNQEKLKVVHSRSHLNEGTRIYIQSLHNPVTTPLGSSLKMMYIAEGKQDVYPKVGGKMMEWDTCAPQIILEEAGGMMVCLEKGRPLQYNKEQLVQPDFLALGKLIAYPDNF
jgi:3'(2'), 5'-bisphosphate nucleotidase